MTWSSLILSATLAVAPVQAPGAQPVVSAQEITNHDQLLSSNLEELLEYGTHFDQNSRFKRRQLLKNGQSLPRAWLSGKYFEHSDQKCMNFKNQGLLDRLFIKSTFSGRFACSRNVLPSLLQITDTREGSILQASFHFIEKSFFERLNQHKVQSQLIPELTGCANFLCNSSSKHEIFDQSSGQFWNGWNSAYSRTNKFGIDFYSREILNVSLLDFEFFQKCNRFANCDSIASVIQHVSDTGSSLGFFFRDSIRGSISGFIGDSIGFFNRFSNTGISHRDNFKKRIVGVSVILDAFKLSLPVQLLGSYLETVNFDYCILFESSLATNTEQFQSPIGNNDCRHHTLIRTESA